MAIEDFTTYTVGADTESVISVDDSNTITVTNIDNNQDDVYVYKDAGAAHFNTDFTHLIEAEITASLSATFFVWGVSDTVGDFQSWNDGLGLCNRNSGARWYLYQAVNGTISNFDSWIGGQLNTKYYFEIVRDSTAGTLTVYIRTGSHEGTLQDTLTGSYTEENDYQYVYPLASGDDGTGGRDSSVIIENLDLLEPGGSIIPQVTHHYRANSR